MEQMLLLAVPAIMVCACVIIFTLAMTHLVNTVKKNKAKVKKLELHAGKHHWFTVEYK